MPPPLILASGSPRRAQLLRELELEFTVVISDAPEAEHEHLTARELAQLNAWRKAHAVAKLHPQAVVLGCDTVVTLADRHFAKPGNLKEAAAMLRALSGNTHQVVTGCCLVRLKNHSCRIFHEQTHVRFRELNNVTIQRYLRAINPLDKAGAYAIQEHGDLIVEGIEGSYTNVIGLPTEVLVEALKIFGIVD